MAHVSKVQVLEGFTLQITFDDGFVRVVDLEPMMWGPVFAPLRNRRRFREVRVNRRFGCIEWPNGADLCPDALYQGYVPKFKSESSSELKSLCLSYKKASNSRKKEIVNRLSKLVKSRRSSVKV